MKRCSTLLFLTVLFVLLAAQSSCQERTCKTLAAVGAVRAQLAAVGIDFGSDEELLAAVLDGTIDALLGDKLDEDALVAVRALLAVIRGLCPADRAALGQMLQAHAPVGGAVDVVELLERRLAALAEEQ